MNKDTPKIVSLETSLELSEFPSESEFISESEPRTDSPAPAVEAPEIAAAPSIAASKIVSIPPAEPKAEAVPPPSAIVTQSVRPQTPAEPVSTVASVTQITSAPSRDRGPEAKEADEAARPQPPSGPAVVAEFPIKPQIPAAVAMPSLPPGPVSLVELIERRGGFDWREAVAVIQQICVYLKHQAPQTPILLDPRTIQITERGEVRMLSGQTTSDPLVIQVGRLLRTMLMGKEVPPELRLLLSQATFELPIFESIEDVDRALAQLNKLDEPGPAGLALLRTVAAPPPPPDPEQDFDHRPPPIRSILPTNTAAARRRRGRSGLRSVFGGYGSHVAVIFAGIAVIAILLGTRPAILFPAEVPAPPSGQVVDLAGNAGTTANGTAGSSTPQAAPLSGSGSSSRSDNPPRTSARRTNSPVSTPTSSGHRQSPERTQATNGPRPTAPRADASRATSTIVVPPPPAPVTSPREHERRARELFEGGKTSEASLAFDALVMSNPLYEPRTTDLTPEALAAFRRSQQTILPVKAEGNYEKGKTALAGGDYDTALRLAREALAILDRHPESGSPALRDQLEDLTERSRFAKATASEVIYSEADAEVIPPRQLSRQMPLTGPVGVPPNRVGWLDMIISEDGTVYQVKLHTPLNRHHERMIVSAAKAWLYAPAMRNGKPVMYKIKVKVNLPESGTDDNPF